MALDTRDRILDTAARLFHEQGYGATGVATILREAGVNSGSLYHFFSSKDALLLGVLTRYQERLGSEVMGPVEAVEPEPLERIFALLAWYRGNLERGACRLGCPIGNLALEVSDTHPDTRPEIRANFELWTASVQAWLEASHRLPDRVDRRALARFVLTIMEGAVMQARAANDLAAFDDSVSQLRAYVNALVEERARQHVSTQPPV